MCRVGTYVNAIALLPHGTPALSSMAMALGTYCACRRGRGIYWITIALRSARSAVNELRPRGDRSPSLFFFSLSLSTFSLQVQVHSFFSFFLFIMPLFFLFEPPVYADMRTCSMYSYMRYPDIHGLICRCRRRCRCRCRSRCRCRCRCGCRCRRLRRAANATMKLPDQQPCTIGRYEFLTNTNTSPGSE